MQLAVLHIDDKQGRFFFFQHTASSFLKVQTQLTLIEYYTAEL